ncbi:hypothetical protein ABW20_dc0100365 [Dactylellina cionopaga]|nr:hypothetical protein ABW20_dc0100365 [Dactylellina cionopaga]
MKFTTQLITSALLLVASVSAAPARRSVDIEARAEPAHDFSGWVGSELDKRQDKKSPKDFIISRAQRHNATTERIDFLKSVPDATFQAMFDADRKIHQATKALWNQTVPDMAALPTPFTPPPGGFPARNGTRGRGGRGGPGGPGGPDGVKGQRPSKKDFFVRWAEKQGATPEAIDKLKATDDAEFEKLKDLSVKDRFVKEADLMGLADQSTFFKNTVPQAVYDELDQLKTKVKTAHQDLKDSKIPTM